MLLSDYNGDIVKLDLKRGELSLEEAKDLEVKQFNKLYTELRKFQILKNEEVKKIAFIKRENDFIRLVNYGDGIQTLYELEEGRFHDFEYERNYISAIGEDETHVVEMKSKRILKCYSESGWYMMRGKFMIKKEKIFFFIPYWTESTRPLGACITVCPWVC